MSALRRAFAVATVSAVALTGCTSGPKAADRAAAGAPNPTSSSAGRPADDTPSDESTPAVLVGHLTDVKATRGDKFALFGTQVDPSGSKHVRYTRSYHGIKVYGGDVVVHTDPKGAFRGVSNGLAAPLNVDTTPRVPASVALAAARSRFTGSVGTVEAPRLLIDASAKAGRLMWESVVVGTAPDRTPSRLHVITDARSGAVVGSWDEIETIAGTGKSLYSGTVTIETQKLGPKYQLTDTTRGRGTVCDMNNKETGECTAVTDDDNVWGTGNNSNRQSAAVDAAHGAEEALDYYKTVFGRKGISDDGRGVPSRVHFGNEYGNAFWNGKEMTYGDGKGNAWPLVEVDAAAHEMSHGVTEKSVPGGMELGEAGGINEATSDIFGTMIEFFANNPSDPPDYLIGESINFYGDHKPLRVMYNPPLDRHGSVGCWSPVVKDLPDLHAIGGVANHFFFDLAEGTGRTKYGTSPVCGSAGGVKGIGRDKAQQIWYRALTVYFTSATGYVTPDNPDVSTRAATLKAAADLYGNCGTEYKAVQKAWTAVNVAGNDAACK